MVKCLRNDQMPFFWLVLVFLGKQRFKMLHKSENWPQGQNWWCSQMSPSVLVNLCPNHFFVEDIWDYRLKWVTVYIQCPISIDRFKYLLKYAIWKKMIMTKIVKDSGGHLSVLMSLTFRSIFEVIWRLRLFLKWKPLFLTSDSKTAGNFTLEMIFSNLLLWPWDGTIKVKLIKSAHAKNLFIRISEVFWNNKL